MEGLGFRVWGLGFRVSMLLGGTCKPPTSSMTRVLYTKMGETISYPKLPPRLVFKILHDLRLLLDHKSYA